MNKSLNTYIDDILTRKKIELPLFKRKYSYFFESYNIILQISKTYKILENFEWKSKDVMGAEMTYNDLIVEIFVLGHCVTVPSCNF